MKVLQESLRIFLQLGKGDKASKQTELSQSKSKVELYQQATKGDQIDHISPISGKQWCHL